MPSLLEEAARTLPDARSEDDLVVMAVMDHKVKCVISDGADEIQSHDDYH